MNERMEKRVERQGQSGDGAVGEAWAFVQGPPTDPAPSHSHSRTHGRCWLVDKQKPGQVGHVCPGLRAGPALRSCGWNLWAPSSRPQFHEEWRQRPLRGGANFLPGPSTWAPVGAAITHHSEPPLVTPSLLLLLQSDSELDQGRRLVGTGCQWWDGPRSVPDLL